MANFLLIIDWSSLLATSYYGNLPPVLRNNKLSPSDAEKHYDEILHASDGTYTNAIFGFMKTLIDIVRNQKPDYIVVNWDETRSTFRRNLYPEYKGTRGDTPQPLKDQIVLMKKILTFIGIKQFSSSDYEADDFSGSLAKYFSKDTFVRILTKDRDHLQLVDNKVNVWLKFPIDKDGESSAVNTLNDKFGVDATKLNLPLGVFRVTPDLVKPYYGVDATQVVDFKALMGDTADNIPGVPGIGEKTAKTLLENFYTLSNLYSFLESKTEDYVIDEFKKLGVRGGAKVYRLLIDGKDSAVLSRKLATIKTDIPFGNMSLDIFKTNINEANLIATLKRLDFNWFLKTYYPNV